MIKKTIFIWVLITFIAIANTHARTFKVAAYNVENLFDMRVDGSEYDQYVPGAKGWNARMLQIKLDNLARVIVDLNADVIALQEIENSRALTHLRHTLKDKGLDYPHREIADGKPSAVKCAVLSKFPITDRREIRVKGASRTILQVTLDIERRPLVLFINHWKSKRGPESKRIIYAQALKARIDRLSPETDYIALGDFNSNYNEYETIVEEPRLNDAQGRTGINHILKTLHANGPVDERMLMEQAAPGYLYNLWFELEANQRWSHQYIWRKDSVDHILVPQALYDDQGVSYVDDSFAKFSPTYLFKNKDIYRWQITDKGKGRHSGRGFSDHLPIYAQFTTQPFIAAKPPAPLQSSSIAVLYEMNPGRMNYRLDNCAVIYKYKNNAVIKQAGGRAIFIYRASRKLKLGGLYQLTVKHLQNYHGLLEITQIGDVQKSGEIKQWEPYLITPTDMDLSVPTLQNEVIDRIEGIYHYGLLHYGNDQKICLYFGKKSKLKPPERTKIELFRVRIGFYNCPQLVIRTADQIKTPQ